MGFSILHAGARWADAGREQRSRSGRVDRLLRAVAGGTLRQPRRRGRRAAAHRGPGSAHAAAPDRPLRPFGFFGRLRRPAPLLLLPPPARPDHVLPNLFVPGGAGALDPYAILRPPGLPAHSRRACTSSPRLAGNAPVRSLWPRARNGGFSDRTPVRREPLRANRAGPRRALGGPHSAAGRPPRSGSLDQRSGGAAGRLGRAGLRRRARSEEHTSEI